MQCYLASEKWSASTDMENFPWCTKEKTQGRKGFAWIATSSNETNRMETEKPGSWVSGTNLRWRRSSYKCTVCAVSWLFHYIHLLLNSQNLKWSEINQMGKEIIKWLMWISKLKHDNIPFIVLCGLITNESKFSM